MATSKTKEKAKARTCGTALLTCVNHPTYRWVKTKYGVGFIGNGVLMFRGAVGDKREVHPLFVMSEATIAARGRGFERYYRKHYIPECDCPQSDLVFVSWAEDED